MSKYQPDLLHSLLIDVNLGSFEKQGKLPSKINKKINKIRQILGDIGETGWDETVAQVGSTMTFEKIKEKNPSLYDLIVPR